MKLARTVAAAALVSLVASPRLVSAEELSESEAFGQLAGIVTLNPAPLVMGVVDVIGHPTSKVYGGAEIVAGGAALAFNGYMIGDRVRRDQNGVGLFVGLAAIDAAVVVHGIYLVTRSKHDPLVVTWGRARGRVSPTVVQDGAVSAAGLGLIGSF